jgi:hypothetical protein
MKQVITTARNYCKAALEALRSAHLEGVGNQLGGARLSVLRVLARSAFGFAVVVPFR